MFHSTEKNRGGTFCLSESFWYRKRLRIRERADITLFRREIVVPQCPKNHVEELLCCRKFLVSKNIMDKRGGMEGVSKFSVEKFLSNNTEYFRWRKLRCLRNFLVSKKFMEKRGMEGVSKVPVKRFLSHSTEKFRWGKHRCLRKNLVSKKHMHKKGRPIISIEKSLSQSVEEMSRDPFVVSPTFWFRKKFG